MATPNRNPTPFSNPDRARPAPRFTRMTRSLRLKSPPDCVASIILRLVVSDATQHVYAFWLIVGRHEQRAVGVAYELTAGDVRCDVPKGEFPSPESLVDPFRAFVERERELRRKSNPAREVGLDPPPPTIKR
jgi:hypothetical protein